ncbi:MAG: uroporphyrinogen decarboxylase family protein [Verrucomicrobiota bacterium]
MNERERFVRTLTCDHPDRPSYGDYLAFDSTQERWEKEGLPKGLTRQQVFDYFGFDHIDIWGNDRLPVNESVMPCYSAETIEETAEYIIRRESGGDVVKLLKNTPPPAMPQFLSYPVTDCKSWLDLKKRLDPDTPGRLPGDLAKRAHDSPNRQTPLGVWLGGTYGLIRNWMGVENASYLFHDDPALVEEMIEHLTFFYSTIAAKIFDAGVKLDWVMFWEDMCYNHGSLLSPEMYARYCLPFYHTMMELVRRNNVKVIMLDCDGNINDLIPLWLDVGINVMHPMEVASGMDVREIRRQYGNQVRFLGGIDKRAVASGPAAIDTEVIPKVSAIMKSGGGMVVQCDHGVPPDISLADFTYCHDLIRRLFEKG